MTEIILYDEKEANAVTLFNNGGLDPFIENIKKVAENFEGDLTTEKGRKEIKSLAYKISNAKSLVDKLRMKENEKHQVEIKANNKKGNKAIGDLQALQDEVRKPVTDWENKDKERVERHKEVLQFIEDQIKFAEWEKFNVSEMQTAIKSIEDNSNRDWEEFSYKAEQTAEKITTAIHNSIVSKIKYDDEQAELKKFREAEETRKQKERDEQIAKEAAEAAKKAAEQEAAKREAAIQEAKEQAEREAKAAEERAAAAEQALKDQAEKASRDAVDAAKKAAEDAVEQAKRVAQAIVDRLNKETEDQKKKDAAELAAREADVAHKKKIIKEMEAAFVHSGGFPARMATVIVESIVDGNIPHITINY
jgi:hypothetical protein